MFKEKTVFILGAGASCNYGYPTGQELIEKIKLCIDNDKIALPEKCKGCSQLVDLIGIDTSNITLSNIPKDALLSKKGVGYYGFYPKSLNEFVDLAQFSTSLKSYDPISIDTFLSHHSEFDRVGKIMIAYSLLKCENPDSFNHKKDADSWYSHLIHDIKSECLNPDDILNNKLTMITFNYDVSLDRFLDEKLKGITYFKDAAEKYLKKLKILHVYGRLHGDFDSYGKYNAPINGDSKFANNIIRMLKSIDLHTNIQLIPERRESDEMKKYKKIIQEASRVIIIGFGFDRDNMKMIGLPLSRSGWTKFLKTKKLQYHNYNGDMQNIARQFEFLGDAVTCSRAKEVTKAYQYDFKLSIF